MGEIEMKSEHEKNVNETNESKTKSNNRVVHENSFVSVMVEKIKNKNSRFKPDFILCEPKTTPKLLLVLTSLIIILVISFIGTYVMWCTSLFENAIHNELILYNNSKAFYAWQTPEVKQIMKVHIFNYTNTEDFLARRADKLTVEDVGPYVYEETMERVNSKYNGDGTISYQERRSYKFMPELSEPYRQHDRVIVPNVPVIGAIAMTKDSYFMARWGMSRLLNSLDAKIFLELPAHRFLWGYEDKFVNLAKGVLAFKRPLPYDKFGMLAARNGTSRDIITMYTGENDRNNLAVIKQFNGQEKINYWSTDECNRIDGTDGTVFPLKDVLAKKPLYIYNKDICRRLPFVYSGKVMDDLDKTGDVVVEGLRYKLPENIFSSPDVNPENQCFCHLDSGTCAPEGVFNASACNFGAPALASFPHFYLADPKLRENIEGLHPDPKDHGNYLDIHPNLGFPLAGVTKIQLNIQIKKVFLISQLDPFPDDIILPVIWMEFGTEKLPKNIVNAIYHGTVTVAILEYVLKFTSLITAIATSTILLTWIYSKIANKK